MERKPVVLAEILFSNEMGGLLETSGCILCGDSSGECACFGEGVEIEGLINNARGKIIKAQKITDSLDPKRDRRDEGHWVLANIKIPAKRSRLHASENGHPSYLEFTLGIPKTQGCIKVFVFGATEDDTGKWVCGICQLKSKEAEREGQGGRIYYLRFEVVQGVRSDATLTLRLAEMRDELSIFHSMLPPKGEKLPFAVGFKKYEPAVATPLARNSRKRSI